MKGVPKVKKIDLTCPPKLCERPRKSERVGHQPTITSNTSPKPPKKRPPDSNLRPSACKTNNLTPLPIPHATQPLIPEVVMFLSPIYRSISSHENLPLLSHLRKRVNTGYTTVYSLPPPLIKHDIKKLRQGKPAWGAKNMGNQGNQPEI